MDKLHENRLVFILMWLCIIVFVSGCWDSRNIEDISLEVASGLDKADEQTSEETDDPQGKPLVTLTLQSAVLQQSSGGSDVGNEQKKAYKNVVVTGKTFLEAFRKISLQEPRPPFGQHTKIIIGEEIARDMNLENVLNLYLRTFEIRRSSTVLIAKGKARQVLETPGNNDIPGYRLLGIYQNQSKTNEMLPIITLGQMANKMAADASFVLQTVEAQQGKAKFDGGAIIKGSSKRLIGFLNRKEISGLNWLTGKGQGGNGRSI
jgi:spore germination protein